MLHWFLLKNFHFVLQQTDSITKLGPTCTTGIIINGSSLNPWLFKLAYLLSIQIFW